MSTTSNNTTPAAAPPPPRKKQTPARRAKPPKLSKADALEILRTALAECQQAGLSIKPAQHQRGLLLLLSDVELSGGVFVFRDQDATNTAVPASQNEVVPA